MTDRRLILVAYRSVLRWARDNAAVPFQLRRGDVLLLAPGVVPTTLQDAAAVSQIARAAFHLNKDLKVSTAPGRARPGPTLRLGCALPYGLWL
ncbi:hypothetical protein APUTEX25_004615 [Auxenochlorella protothecoides]|uniref:Uncharacterized protein n=1 Tax=Auxenochlorella protothecoides TaxID=3075 RepID=A0A3M7L4C3_AUXPR|nr:hypothetical protein APUTEX25_004615 [Auxenochlorella protothecoides]|eukprot:RMZ56392.1 hypothetical protein APUTEX25_004615 [Auxenochlorella protothecoides]